jgi:hypothetical protein
VGAAGVDVAAPSTSINENSGIFELSQVLANILDLLDGPKACPKGVKSSFTSGQGQGRDFRMHDSACDFSRLV